MKGVPCGLNQRSTEVEWKENEYMTPHDVLGNRLHNMAIYELKDGVGIIPEGRIVIEERAFQGCKELHSLIVEMPAEKNAKKE